MTFGLNTSGQNSNGMIKSEVDIISVKATTLVLQKYGKR
jgi:hypothetical protein